jgi:regulator of protease activity HflC (stomatin/prohibitin superfamily)
MRLSNRAVGQVITASRFLALQNEYEKVPDVIRTRRYLEAMERILPKLQLNVPRLGQGAAAPVSEGDRPVYASSRRFARC